jgi:hypothetical protein
MVSPLGRLRAFVPAKAARSLASGVGRSRRTTEGGAAAAAMLVLASGSVTATRASPRWGARPAAAVPLKAARRLGSVGAREGPLQTLALRQRHWFIR